MLGLGGQRLLDHYLHLNQDMIQLLLSCFAHLLISKDPDRHQNGLFWRFRGFGFAVLSVLNEIYMFKPTFHQMVSANTCPALTVLDHFIRLCVYPGLNKLN